ncbi:MAG: hypothetical protein WC852_05940 [Candidatus Nanoarchaeia archaeon]|jgi:chromosome segregation ATPase
MKNLIINRLKYCITCEDNSKYGAEIVFKLGLNIIFGPNSVGKTSIITGIIYGLGAEKVLGIFQSTQNPFKPEFNKEIDGKHIKESFLILEISNGKEVICIKRNIIDDTNIALIKECGLIDFDKTKDYEKLIIEGKGVMEEKGFQKYIYKFLGWSIVDVPRFEGGASKLYFENLVPLFFVEQRGGWSEIQARQIQRYAIRDIKKVAFEYIMGLNKFDIHLIELQKKEISENINRLKTELEFKETNILILGNATINEERTIFVEKIDYGKYPLIDLINQLKEDLNEKEKALTSIEQQKDKAESFENKGRDKLRQISHSRIVANEKISALTKEIAGYNNYIEKIELNKRKNSQLNKINQLSDELNISFCPLCQTELNQNEEDTCRLCKSVIKNISTPEENICFLEDEKASFEKIIVIKNIELEKAKKSYEDIVETERQLKERIDFQLKTYYGDELDKRREKIAEADAIRSDIDKYIKIINQWKQLDPIRKEISTLINKEKDLKEKIKKYTETINDQNTLSTILSNFKGNISKLRLFKSRDELIKEIRLDYEENYTPYLPNDDLYNISSSSDNIRIIISYYLALLQTSLQIDSSPIRFPNLLILDEPKQQNLDSNEISSCIKIIESFPKKAWQIILTTYQEQDKDIFKKNITYEMKDSKDYLLKKVL